MRCNLGAEERAGRLRGGARPGQLSWPTAGSCMPWGSAHELTLLDVPELAFEGLLRTLCSSASSLR